MAKREVITHTKLKRLKRHLGLEDWGALGVLEALWHLTAREARLGDIGRLQNEDIADAIGWRTDPDALIAALVSSGWVDEHPVHRLIIHDWAEHSDDTIHAYIARKREWFADGTAPRFSRLNSSERAAAAAFYATGPEAENTEAQAQTPEALPEHSESLLGESGSTPTRQEVTFNLQPSTFNHASLPQTPKGDEAAAEESEPRPLTDDERHRFDWETVEQFLGRTLNHRRDWEPFVEQRRICEQRGFPLGPKFIRELAEEKLAEFEAKRQRPRYVTPLVEAMRDAVDEIAGGRLVLR